MTSTFDFASTIAECYAYVDAIEDFIIKVPGKTEYTADAIIHYESSERIKILLHEFLLECKQAFGKSQLDLIQLLRSNRKHYQATQGSTIGRLNEYIKKAEGEDRTIAENQKDRLLNFFHHNYTIIDLILARATKSPLSEHLQFNLKKAGLDWVIDGNQQPEPLSTSLEPEKGLSAAQKLLFIRLLQEQDLFPKKPNNTDDAPELRAIALITGLSYENQIKGSKGAVVKVNQLLNDKERSKLTLRQSSPKIDDLNEVERVARLLNVNSIIIRIDQLRKDLNQIS